MKYLLLSLLLLTGCSTTVPVTVRFPEPPGLQSQTACPNLKKLEENTQLSEVAKTITTNYTEYYTCAVKLDAWIEWYAKQKIIFERVSK
jgi:hypothetical protein